MTEQNPILSLNGKDYDLNSQPENVKALIVRIKKTEHLIEMHQIEVEVLNDARNTQLTALEELLESSTKAEE